MNSSFTIVLCNYNTDFKIINTTRVCTPELSDLQTIYNRHELLKCQLHGRLVNRCSDRLCQSVTLLYTGVPKECRGRGGGGVMYIPTKICPHPPLVLKCIPQYFVLLLYLQIYTPKISQKSFKPGKS